MTGRVLLGLRAGEYGIWVSKPGVNVITAGDDALLLSSSRRSAQVVASGIISASSGGSYGISWGNLGFVPVILVGSARFPSARCSVTSLTTATITAGIAENFSAWTAAPSFPSPPYAVSYSVLNVPA